MDSEHGGVYTCLDRAGRLYSTDKSVWMQGRCGWTYAYLCHIYGVREEWLAASKSCIDFLEEHCVNHDAEGRLYFTVEADGTPLRQRRYCYSEAFYCIANAEYYGVTGEREHLLRARRAYDMYWNLNHGMADPTGMGPKSTRTGRALGIPMIILNVTGVMKRVDPEMKDLYDERAKECVHDIFAYHVKPELGVTLESVALDGTPRLHVTEGRMVNPGHDIECAWFLMDYANEVGDKELHAKAINVFDMAFNKGWDDEFGGILYFTVEADGTPLRQRRYCYSEAFYCIANAEYYGVTGEREHLLRARRAYDMYWNLNHGMADPTGMGPKSTRTGRALGIPMIILNVTGVMKRVDPEMKHVYDERAKECVHDIFAYHVREDLGCTLESVALDGTARLNVTEGRMVNPGHDIECAWFLMDYANEVGDAELHQKAIKVFDMAFEKGWDSEYGGILYFMDCLGNPPEAYEHDMKLWWPHNEALIASMMIYRDTRDEKYLDIFYQILDYCKKVFADEYGEWYGYLRRDGKPTLPACKGSTFKGPFHVPRCLIMVDQMMTEILGE